MKRALLCAVLATALAAPCAYAQNERPTREVWALTNARIVVAPGRVIERGTVVVRDGRIEAVGPRVTAPVDAFPMDLDGLTMYAGLIDVASAIGLPRIGPQAGGPGGGQAAGSEGSEIRPSRLASDEFGARDADLEALRAVGITTVGLAFDGGILPGRAAAVTTGAVEDAARSIRAPVAQQVAFGTARGAYPTTLMGTLAHIRQTFHDAAHARASAAAFARDPGSVRRPAETDDMRSVAAAGAREIPVWIAASRENDLRRALDLGRELNLDVRLLGAEEGYRMTSELVRHGQPVLVSLDFLRAPQVTGRAFEMRVTPLGVRVIIGGGAEAYRVREELARRDVPVILGSLLSSPAADAPYDALWAQPAVLARAGVRFAFSTGEAANARNLPYHAAMAVAFGLSPERAWHALTLAPAEIWGVADRLGSIEPGKSADLFLATGDPLDVRTTVRDVWIAGRRIETTDRHTRFYEHFSGRP